MTLVNSRFQLEDFSSITGSPSATWGNPWFFVGLDLGEFRSWRGMEGSSNVEVERGVLVIWDVFSFGPTITTQSKKSWAQVFRTKLRNMYFCSAYFFRYRYVTLQTYIWICMCIYLSMYLRLYIYLSVCLSIYLPNLILAYLIYIYLYYLYYLYYLSLSLYIYIYTCMNRDIRRYVSVYGTCLSSCI